MIMVENLGRDLFLRSNHKVVEIILYVLFVSELLFFSLI